ncbi:aminomethyltransferase, partial [Xanthobacter autotrophicus]
MDASLLPPGPSPTAPPRERVVVRGGGMAAVSLGAGDRLTVLDPEGLQPALVFVTDTHAVADWEGAGVETLPALLDQGGEGSAEVARLLAENGFAPTSLAGRTLLSRDGRAG